MTTYNDQLSEYITELFVNQDKALKFTQVDTTNKGLPGISIKPEEGKFLQFLVRASNAISAVEIGTLGGYSGIWISRGLAPGGKLITIEKEPKHAAIAREHFERAGVAERVEIRVGDAHQILQSLRPMGPFDFVFIDADKPGYPAYFDWALVNVRLGGVIACHNAFRGGSVAGLRRDDDFSEMMRTFNRRVANESRVISTVYPAGDGMVVCVKVE